MTEPIREDEWLAELERFQVLPDDPGLTCRELMELWKCSDRTALGRLKMLHDQGRLGVGRKSAVGIDGRKLRIACYRLKDANA